MIRNTLRAVENSNFLCRHTVYQLSADKMYRRLN